MLFWTSNISSFSSLKRGSRRKEQRTKNWIVEVCSRKQEFVRKEIRTKGEGDEITCFNTSFYHFPLIFDPWADSDDGEKDKAVKKSEREKGVDGLNKRKKAKRRRSLNWRGWNIRQEDYNKRIGTKHIIFRLQSTPNKVYLQCVERIEECHRDLIKYSVVTYCATINWLQSHQIFATKELSKWRIVHPFCVKRILTKM